MSTTTGSRNVAVAEAQADGAIRISYDDLGQGEPALLMLPGWCSSRAMFADLAPRTATRRRTLALDWRGHGRSGAPLGDFGTNELVEDALAVIEASRVERVVPVAVAHAGWVAIELRRRLGDRVPAIVLIDWIVLDPPPPFLGALEGLQDPRRWEQTWAGLRAMWVEGVDNTAVVRFVQEEMGSYGFDMCARAGREIGAAYARDGNPLQALARLEPSVPVLHLYAQPADPGYLAAQQAFAAEHLWFRVERLEARSHFPMFEVPDEMTASIERFMAEPSKELYCAEVGFFPHCGGVSRGRTEEEVLARAAEHGRQVHGLRDADMTEEAFQLLRSRIRDR